MKRWLAATIIVFTALGFGRHLSADEKSNKLEFENEIIEGENKKPLDSLTELEERGGRKRTRLYEKREDFDEENQDTLRNLIEDKP